MSQLQIELRARKPIGISGPHALYGLRVLDQGRARLVLGYLPKSRKIDPGDVITIEPDVWRRALECKWSAGFPVRLTIQPASESHEVENQTQG